MKRTGVRHPLSAETGEKEGLYRIRTVRGGLSPFRGQAAPLAALLDSYPETEVESSDDPEPTVARTEKASQAADA